MISIVVPVGPAETDLCSFLSRLQLIPQVGQVIFVFCPSSEHLSRQLPQDDRFILITTPAGRGVQLNAGAEAATSDFIWFVHLDSQIANNHWQLLIQSLQHWPERLHYFDIRFDDDGVGPMWLNTVGANLRSRWLGLPFGDQGFCLSKRTFIRLQGYPDEAPYGEDHLFIWQAHHAGIKLQRIAAGLVTSARKYAGTGWGRLTLRYQFIWVGQALPQLWSLIKQKVLG